MKELKIDFCVHLHNRATAVLRSPVSHDVSAGKKQCGSDTVLAHFLMGGRSSFSHGRSRQN